MARVSEIYDSYQGEGPRTGTPTTFVRFAGCNLKCPGWPCDTPHAIDPRIFEKDAQVLSVPDIVEQVKGHYPRNVCFTGGEPLLHKKALIEVGFRLWATGKTIEVFSNGTLEYPDDVLNNFGIVMDWKLPGSGEDPDNIMRMQNLERMHSRSAGQHSVKFVIKDRQDYELAKLYSMRINRNYINLYAGVVWGELTEAELVSWMQQDKLPWRLNVQVHNFIWDRSQRGI